MNQIELKEFLDYKANQYELIDFITSDPIQIPHRFKQKEDVEIAGFLTASIAWGNRLSILKSANKMMALMDNAPYDFIINHKKRDLSIFEGFVHRTFNATDLTFFVRSLQNIYKNHQGLENVFSSNNPSLQDTIHDFKSIFFEIDHPQRTLKHVSDPLKGSAAKRLNMFMRWMVRSNTKGVDFGIWKQHSPAQLSIPLDVHTGNIARKLNLIQRKQNDFKTLKELDKKLRKFDPVDPVKYDYALFGLGVFEKF
ncbi:MAG: TIGR02757 family protein [Flavobacteriaceae bacterium]